MPSSAPRTCCAILTAPGRGAIATVAVAGPRAAETVAGLFLPLAARAWLAEPLGKICFGRWAERDGEELVVCRRADDNVEIHCHGGALASAAIVRSLVAAGCQSITAAEWLAWHSPTLIAAQAATAVTQALTQRTAAILLDQANGALERAIRTVLALLVAGRLVKAAEQICELLQWESFGQHLTEPFHVVLAGPPNAGKSSLLNALVGHQRTIVSSRPGTTRDSVVSLTAIDGWPVELIDTAGLRTCGDALELAGMALSVDQLSAADLRVLVFDGSLPWTTADDALVAEWPQAILVFNKQDLASGPGARPPGFAVSAATGANVDALASLLASHLVPRVPPAGAAVPFTSKQFATLREAGKIIAAGDGASAAATISAMLATPSSPQATLAAEQRRPV